MSKELKKKWYQGFALYSTIFICAIYSIISLTIFRLAGNTPLVFITIDIIAFLFAGAFLFLIKRCYPLYEILLFCFFEIIFIGGPNIVRVLLINYIVASIGAFTGCVLLFLFKKLNINNKIFFVTKIKMLSNKIINSDWLKRTKPFLPQKIYYLYLSILALIFFITFITTSTIIQYSSISFLLLLNGIIIAYITQKIPIFCLCLSMIVFYIPISVIFNEFGISYQTLKLSAYILGGFYYYLISGACIGYGLYKKFSYLTKFEKFSITKLLSKSI